MDVLDEGDDCRRGRGSSWVNLGHPIVINEDGNYSRVKLWQLQRRFKTGLEPAMNLPLMASGDALFPNCSGEDLLHWNSKV